MTWRAMSSPPWMAGWASWGKRVVVDDGAVADGEDAVLAVHPEVRVGDDAAAPAGLEAPVHRGLVGAHSGRPDDDIGGQLVTVLEQHRVVPDLGDGGVGAHVDAALLQLAAGVVAQAGVEGRQQMGAHLDQGDVHSVDGDVGEDRRDADRLHLGEGAGGLDAGRAAADDDDVEGLGLVGVQPLEVGEDDIAGGQRGAAGVDGEGVLGRPGGAEEVGADALGEHDVVVLDGLAGVAVHQAVLGVDAGHRGEPEVGVRAELGREAAQPVGDVAGVQPAGRHLVEQRLEGGVGVLVDEFDVTALGRQRSGGGHPAESPSDHGHPGVMVGERRRFAELREQLRELHQDLRDGRVGRIRRHECWFCWTQISSPASQNAIFAHGLRDDGPDHSRHAVNLQARCWNPLRRE
jgi:hypothetical protein